MAEPQGAYRTSDFEYDLPAELIAQFPTAERGESRLLFVARGSGLEIRDSRLRDARFSEFPMLLGSRDVLVINTTKVRHARLLGRRASGREVEILLLHPATEGTWIAMGKPGPALRPGKRVMLDRELAVETLEILPEGYRRVRFVGGTAEEAIARHGRIPLPPYIDRAPTSEDAIRYQTVYAERVASVAAPTAGLHFTTELLESIRQRGVAIAPLTLAVGPGTFKPVETEDYREHPMHAERFDIPAETAAAIAQARKAGGAIWAVGTTVVRALESAADATGTVRPGPGETRLLITPGYDFKVVDRLLTNFHLPRSTLLMLVAAFAGYELTWRAYHHAIEQRYRFYSYGDAMVVG
jgi:S-adenosylmethionine:tRNA ribosyltransferase-isomerase